MLVNQRKATPSEGRVHSPQLRGSCTAMCVTAYLKDELIRLHGEKGRALFEKFQAYRTRRNITALSNVQTLVSQDVLQRVYKEPSPKKLEQRLKIMKQAASTVLERRTCRAEELAAPKKAPSYYTKADPLPFSPFPDYYMLGYAY
jgi:hypothetical protein